MERAKHTPIIYKYLKQYQQDPSSRIFAPLAEAYRKAGFVDEAIEIAREGLRVHPRFVSGRVALARALFDKKRYQEVLDELSSVVKDVPDNLVAQRLVAESNLMLGRILESLDAYKMLLYFCPEHPETAKIVRELESQVYEKGTLILQVKEKDQQSHDVVVDENSPSRLKWVHQIEFLQSLLLSVERYRLTRQFSLDTKTACTQPISSEKV